MYIYVKLGQASLMALTVKSLCSGGGLGSLISGSGRSPGEGNGKQQNFLP